MIRFATVWKCDGSKQERLFSKVVKHAQDLFFDEEPICEICGERTDFVMVYTQDEGEKLFGRLDDGKERIALVTMCRWHAYQNQKEMEEKIRRKLIHRWQ
ncbi:MAG: hypothetical protein OHK006_17830 [Thermodesulfovibrionales bacterium]